MPGFKMAESDSGGHPKLSIGAVGGRRAFRRSSRRGPAPSGWGRRRRTRADRWAAASPREAPDEPRPGDQRSGHRPHDPSVDRSDAVGGDRVVYRHVAAATGETGHGHGEELSKRSSSLGPWCRWLALTTARTLSERMPWHGGQRGSERLVGSAEGGDPLSGQTASDNPWQRKA